MKKGIVLMMTLLMVGVVGVNAQDAAKKKGGQRAEEKKAFMIEKLSLTEAEQEKLWPLMDEMKKELKANKTAFKDAKPGKDQKIDDMSDADVEKMLNAGFDMKDKDNEIRKSYNSKYISVLGVKRTAKMYHVQRTFKKKKAANAGGKGPKGPGNGPGKER